MSKERLDIGRKLQHFFPVLFSGERGRWLVLQHGAAEALLKSGAVCKAGAREAAADRFPGPALALFHRHNLLFSDPPDHSRLRQVMRALYPINDLEAIQPLIVGISDRLIDDMTAAGAEVDLCAGFAHPLPIQVICGLIGLGHDDLDLFMAWSRIATALAEPGAVGPEDPQAEAIASSAVERIRELIAVAAEDDDSFLFTLRQAISAGELSEDEACSMVLMSFGAGHETTAGLLAECVVTLGADLAIQERVRSGAVPVANFVDEIVRYSSPIQYSEYALSRSARIGGRNLEAGDRVAVMFGLANRDARAHPSPDDLRFDRSTRHLAFGTGRHSCPGRRLAEFETALAVGRLLARLVIEVEPDRVEWSAREFIRSAARIPARIRPLAQ